MESLEEESNEEVKRGREEVNSRIGGHKGRCMGAPGRLWRRDEGGEIEHELAWSGEGGGEGDGGVEMRIHWGRAAAFGRFIANDPDLISDPDLTRINK